MVSEQKKAEETLQESKVAALESSGTMSGPLVGAAAGTRRRRRAEAMQLTLRALCMASSVVALSLMVTAKQASSVSIYGFLFPLHSKWSFSQSYEYASSSTFLSMILLIYLSLSLSLVQFKILFLSIYFVTGFVPFQCFFASCNGGLIDCSRCCSLFIYRIIFSLCFLFWREKWTKKFAMYVVFFFLSCNVCCVSELTKKLHFLLFPQKNCFLI